MKKLFVLLALLTTLSGAAQNTWPQALATAKAGNKLILIIFSGSDWCIPCIRQEKAVFSQADFAQFATQHLVLVHADFPRLKKNQLSKEAQKDADALAEMYNPKGSFPYTVLTTAAGVVLKEWDGEVATSAQPFIHQIEPFINAR